MNQKYDRVDVSSAQKLYHEWVPVPVEETRGGETEQDWKVSPAAQVNAAIRKTLAKLKERHTDE